MTTTAAVNRIATDGALPLRDVLLDATAMAPVLSSLGIGRPAHVESCALVRVNYQVGKSVRAVYRIAVDGSSHTVAARMFRRGKSADVYARSRGSAGDLRDLRGIAHDPELECVFWLFPNDRKIGTLAAVLDPATGLPGTPGRPAHKRLAAYAPEKSATIACEDDDRRPLAYAKVAAAHQAARDYETYVSLRAAIPPNDSRLRLPEPLAYDAARRTLWLEAVDGRRMADAGPDDEAGDLERLGRAVAVFHGLPAGRAPKFDRFAPARLTNDAAILRSSRPDVSDRVDALVAHLIETAPRFEPAVCLHGDLHPKNAIVSDGRIALIDVEDVAAGPAAADIGSLLASLIYLREAHRLAADACAHRFRAFLTGYESARPLPSESSLAWHTAAALFIERASRAVTRVRPLGLANLPELLRASETLLDRGLEA